MNHSAVNLKFENNLDQQRMKKFGALLQRIDGRVTRMEVTFYLLIDHFHRLGKENK